MQVTHLNPTTCPVDCLAVACGNGVESFVDALDFQRTVHSQGLAEFKAEYANVVNDW